MLQSLRFGEITKARLINPPRYQDYPFTPEEAAIAPSDVTGPRRKKAYEEADKAAWIAYRQKIDQYLQQLAAQHSGEKDYYAAAIPTDHWNDTLIVDGDDFKQLGIDILLKKQHFLSAFVSIKARGGGAALQQHELQQEPLPPVYNWKNAYASGYKLDRTRDLAERTVIIEYVDKATKTLDIHV